MDTKGPSSTRFELGVPGGQPISTLPLFPASRLQEVLDRDQSTLWRWRKRGWLPPLVFIGGRAYYQTSQLAEFFRRATAGDLATPHCPPKPPAIGKDSNSQRKGTP